MDSNGNHHSGSNKDERGDFMDDYESDIENPFLPPEGTTPRPSQHTPTGSYQHTITSYDNFVHRRRERHDDLVAAALASEKSKEVPGTDAEMLRYARAIFESIKNTTDIDDKEVKKGASTIPAQAVRHFLEDKYHDEEIEIMAWTILEAARDVHLGIDPKIAVKDKLSKEVFKTFDDRMQRIIDVCRRSKAACKQLLATSYVSRLVVNPSGEIKAKNNNAVLNAKRDIENSKGRDVLKNMSLEEKTALGYSVSSPEKRSTPSDSKKKSTRSAKKRKTEAKVESSPDTIEVPAATPSRRQRSTRQRRTSSNVPLPSSTPSNNDNDDTDINDPKVAPENDMHAHKRSSKGRSTTKKRLGSKATAKSSCKTAVNQSTVAEQSPRYSATEYDYPSLQLQEFTFFSPLKYSENQGSGYCHNPTDLANFDVEQQFGADRGFTNRHEQIPEYSNEFPEENMQQIHVAKDDGGDPDGLYPEREIQFKKQICRILEVPEDWADRLQLWHLRAYARAYDRLYTNNPWVPNRNAPHFIASLSQQADGPFIHISDFIPELRGLAIVRGDILEDGSIGKGRLHSASKDISMTDATSIQFIWKNIHCNDVALGNLGVELRPHFTMSIPYRELGPNNEPTTRLN